MFTVDDIRGLLRLSVEECSDDELERYINLFILQIAAKIGKDPNDEELLNSPLFDEALLSKIACHLIQLDPKIFSGLTAYKVGDTSEEFDDINDIEKRGVPSWCSRYDNALENLTNSFADVNNVLVFRRRGLSAHPGWKHHVF